MGTWRKEGDEREGDCTSHPILNVSGLPQSARMRSALDPVVRALGMHIKGYFVLFLLAKSRESSSQQLTPDEDKQVSAKQKSYLSSKIKKKTFAHYSFLP